MDNNITEKKSNTSLQNDTESKLLKYVQERVCDKESLTNSRWTKEKKDGRKFKVDDDDYDVFLNKYIKSVKKDVSHGGYMEKPCEVGPLYFDYDLKTSKLDLFEKSDYKNIVKTTNKVILDYFKTKDKNENIEDLLKSYTLRKLRPAKTNKDNIYSDGFHLHYPNIILNVNERFLIFDEVKERLVESGFFENKEEHFDNGIDDFFDKRVINSNSWFMYGSGKDLNNPYGIKYIFDNNLKSVKDNDLNFSDLVKLFSIRNKAEQKILKVKKEYKDKLEDIENKYIKKKKLNTEDFFINNKNSSNSNSNSNSSSLNPTIRNLMKSDNNVDVDVEDAKKLVKLLSSERARSYDTWVRVGWALFNISINLLDEFREFSKTCKSAYVEGGCEEEWTKCINRNSSEGYKISSLHKWVKEDNLEKYNEFRHGKINKILDEGDIRTDHDVATIIHEYYKHEFVCADIDKNVWYQFKGHRWKIIQKASGLSLKMSKEITIEFAKLYSSTVIKAMNCENQDKDKFLLKSKQIDKLVQNLKNKTFKDRIISEAALLFYRDDFIETLDQNPYIVGFKNGVFDLKTKKFRAGEPDDLVSITTNYDYIEYNENDTTIKEIESFYQKIQPNESVRLLLQVYTASMFEGGNKDQKILLFLGVGSNGKGTYIDLIDGTFGMYYDTLSPTVFTQKRGSSSNATPELADKYNKRSVGFQEIDADDKFHLGLLKSITGQDKIPARPLYGQPFSYVPLFKLFAAMNVEPIIESDDNGTWRRILKVDFPTVFRSNPKKPNEVKGDPDIREKIKNWYPAHAWLLLNKYYPIYKKNGGLEKLIPDSVRLSTDKYKNDSNIYMEFMNDSIKIDDNSKIEKSLLWHEFKEWYIACYNSKNQSSNKKLMAFFEKNGYKVDRGINGFVHGIMTDTNVMTEVS